MPEFFHKPGGKGTRAVEVSNANPLPVALKGSSVASVTQYTHPTIIAVGRLYHVLPFEVPGIVAADALDALDMMGTVFSIPVPKAGAIVKALYHDLDDENIAKELWMFRNDPGTMPASDAAFSLTDAQNMQVVDMLAFSTFRDGINSRVGVCQDLPCWYSAPNGFLWFALQTSGADNIAAGSMPRISMLIERYGDD